MAKLPRILQRSASPPRAPRPSRTGAAGPWRWAVLGASVGAVVALLVFAPARWVAGALEQSTGGQLVLAEPRGTVWEGSAQLVLSGGAGSRDAAALPGRLEWRLLPRSYGLAARLHAPCCMADAWRIELRPRWGGAQVRVADGGSHWPASLLGGLGTPWNTVKPEGRLELSTQSFSLDWNAGRLTLAGQLRLDANEMSSRLSTLRPMGSYRITLQGGPSATLRVETLEGSSLQLTGSGQWVGSRLRFEGIASAAPDRVDALGNLLNIIGRRDGPRSIIRVG